MKHISTKKVFFTILHHPPLQHNMFGFIEGQKIKNLQKGIVPSGGTILAPFGNPISFPTPKG
jgi:hypothetical protein